MSAIAIVSAFVRDIITTSHWSQKEYTIELFLLWRICFGMPINLDPNMLRIWGPRGLLTPKYIMLNSNIYRIRISASIDKSLQVCGYPERSMRSVSLPGLPCFIF